MNQFNDYVVSRFKEIFSDTPTHYFECGGRMEIIGNHTDHNNGTCLVAGCSLGLYAAIRKTEDNVIHIVSDGYDDIYIDLASLNGRREEFYTSKGIVRGVAAKFVIDKYKIGGFDAFITSTIFDGAGISSSAAFEVLIAKILEVLYNDQPLTKLALARISHYSETKYFGKPCGFLDQIGVAYGGLNHLDFKTEDEPVITKLNFDMPLHIYLVYTGASHAQLTHLYKAIKDDMLFVADRVFHKPNLRLVTKDEFFTGIAYPVDGVSENQKLRAQHFIDELDRVEAARQAIIQKDATGFLNAIRQSGFSSSSFLKNTMHGSYLTSPQRGLDLANSVLKEGACRIHGGGFAGTIICFVKEHEVEAFQATMIQAYGERNVREVDIRQEGATYLCLTSPSK
ncbi:MAG: galactokinase family protein [Bacilli bacterium]|jgi:galactokinase